MFRNFKNRKHNGSYISANMEYTENFKKAQEAFSSEVYELAIKHCEVALSLATTDKERAYAYHFRGMSYTAMKMIKESISDYKVAMCLQPNNNVFRDTLKQLGLINTVNKKETDEAISSLLTQATKYCDLGNFVQALDYCDKAITIAIKNSDLALIHRVRGLCYLSAGMTKEAFDDMGKTVFFEPNNIEHQNTLNKLRDHSEVNEKFMNKIKSAMDSAAANQHDQAIDYYNEALNWAISDSDRALVYHNRGYSRFSLGKEEDAKNDFEKAVDLSPGDDFYRNSLEQIIRRFEYGM